MRKLLTFVVAVVAILFVLSFAKNSIAKSAVEGVCRAVTGLELKIRSLNLGIVNSLIRVEDLRLFNPPGFKDRTMVDIPEIYVDIDAGSIMSGEVRLKEVRLNMEELVIVKNADGRLNLDSLKPEAKKKEEAKPGEKKAGPKMRIDLLLLRVNRVIYKDYSKREPTVREFNVNLNEKYENIDNINALVPLIMSRAVMNTAVSSLVRLDMKDMMSSFDVSGADLGGIQMEKLSGWTSGLKEQASGALSQITGSAGETGGAGAGEESGDAVEGLKSLFGSLTGND